MNHLRCCALAGAIALAMPGAETGAAPPQADRAAFAPVLAVYRDGWLDLNKNGRQDVYENPRANIDARIENLLSQMTIEEKTVQMATLYGYGRVLRDPLPTPQWKQQLWKDGIGNIDEMHNGFGEGKGSPHAPLRAVTSGR